jgi:hypothetical protein
MVYALDVATDGAAMIVCGAEEDIDEKTGQTEDEDIGKDDDDGAADDTDDGIHDAAEDDANESEDEDAEKLCACDVLDTAPSGTELEAAVLAATGWDDCELGVCTCD